jgi:hypothetical protein
MAAPADDGIEDAGRQTSIIQFGQHQRTQGSRSGGLRDEGVAAGNREARTSHIGICGKLKG